MYVRCFQSITINSAAGVVILYCSYTYSVYIRSEINWYSICSSGHIVLTDTTHAQMGGWEV